MRLCAWAVATAAVLALAVAGPASASPATVVHSKFEGRVATASWDACGLDGCFQTTARVSVGTTTRDGVTRPTRAVSISRYRNPAPAGVSRVIGTTPDDIDPIVQADLSAASWSGEATIYSQDCSDEGVCHGASYEPLGRAYFSASWTATGARERYHERERQEVSRLTGEECVYTTKTSGWRRPATASLVISELADQPGWAWPLGSLTSASISQVKSKFTSRCTSPF